MCVNYIPSEECIDRHLYRINSRNLRTGVFREETGGFVGIRTKFGDRFLFEEFHWDNGEPYGTVKPIEDMGVVLPDDVELEESLGTSCLNCGVKCEYVKWPEGGEREIVCSNGFKMMVSGRWMHLEETACVDVRACSVENKALFDWLDAHALRGPE